MLEADPGRAIPLLREEALDVVANLGQAQIGPLLSDHQERPCCAI